MHTKTQLFSITILYSADSYILNLFAKEEFECSVARRVLGFENDKMIAFTKWHHLIRVTLGYFAIPSLSEVVTLSAADLGRCRLGETSFFDAKLPFRREVTLSPIRCNRVKWSSEHHSELELNVIRSNISLFVK